MLVKVLKRLFPFAAAGWVASALAGTVAYAPAEAAGLPFDDISSSFAKQEIVSLYEQGLVSGVGSRMFQPNRPVTRAEFATLLIRLFGLEPVDSAIPSYRDTPNGAWYYGSVEAASQLGLLQGMADGTFDPGAPLTREQAAVAVVRALRLGTPEGTVAYIDARSISPWAAAAVAAADRAGLLRGDAGSFRPQDPITRAEAAVLFSRIEQNAVWTAIKAATPNLGLQVGWQYQQTTDQFIASVRKSNVNVLVPRVFFLDDAADFTDNTDPALVQWAAANGKQVWGMFGNRSDAAKTHALLSDPDSRKSVVSRLTALVQKYGMDGINLDFENVGEADRAGLTSFVTELASSLHPIGKKLSVDVSPDLGSDWTAAFDYAELGKQADYIVLMGYDEHWSGSATPGSVSSLPWLEQGLDTLLDAVPASRTIVGLPFYTRKWSLSAKGSSADLTLAEQDKLIASLGSAVRSWNGTLGQYVFTFSQGSSTYRIWAENSRSLTLKAEAAAQRGTAGLAYWFVGAETPDVWASLRNAAKYGQVHFD